MSGADEHIQSDSDVSHEEDSAVEESETSPIHPSGSTDPKPQGTVITNGNRTPTKKPAPSAFTPPRPDSPLLRNILSSPARVFLPSGLTDPLQASTSQAIYIPGDASVSVPGIAASTSSASTASIITGAGEISNTDVRNAPVTIPLPKDARASVSAPEDVLRGSTSLASNNPEAVEISNTEEGNAAVKTPLPEVEATGSVVVSEAEGGSIPEMIQTPGAVAASSPAITQLEGESIPEIKPAPAPNASTPPRADSLLLRSLLSSPARVFLPAGLTDPPQASTSQAIFIPRDASVSVPGIAAPTSSASTASIISGAGENSNTDVRNAPVTIPLPEDARASVSAPEDVLRGSASLASNNPEAVEIFNTEEGNAAVKILLPEVEATGSVVVSESEGGSIREMIQTPGAVAASSPAITQLEGESIPEIKPAPAPNASTPPRADSLLLRSLLSSPARVFLPAGLTDPLQASTSQAILEGNVPGAIPSVEAASSNVLAQDVVRGNIPESVSIGESGSCVPDTGANAGKSPDLKTVYSKEVGVPADLPAYEATKAGISEAVLNMDANVSKTLQSTIAPKDPQDPEVEEEMETSNPKVSAATAVESGKASELAVEASHTSEPTSEEYSQASATLEEAKTTSERATIGSVSGQTSKPTEETREVSQQQKSTATFIEPRQVTEPNEEPMDTSETSESGQALESKQEPEKIDTKEVERSPLKRPARGRLDDLKSDDTNTPKSPSRRSSRLQALQRTHSESPSPKKERRTVRSSTLERVPSDDKLGIRTRSRRVGSTSSNSEMEGSGDEVKAKRPEKARRSRKDSKK